MFQEYSIKDGALGNCCLFVYDLQELYFGIYLIFFLSADYADMGQARGFDEYKPEDQLPQALPFPTCPAPRFPSMPPSRDNNIRIHLENKDLWSKFDSLGTEMIITKTGRYCICFFSLKFLVFHFFIQYDLCIYIYASCLLQDAIPFVLNVF